LPRGVRLGFGLGGVGVGFWVDPFGRRDSLGCSVGVAFECFPARSHSLFKRSYRSYPIIRPVGRTLRGEFLRSPFPSGPPSCQTSVEGNPVERGEEMAKEKRRGGGEGRRVFVVLGFGTCIRTHTHTHTQFPRHAEFSPLPRTRAHTLTRPSDPTSDV
jgi:hypothetical protein